MKASDGVTPSDWCKYVSLVLFDALVTFKKALCPLWQQLFQEINYIVHGTVTSSFDYHYTFYVGLPSDTRVAILQQKVAASNRGSMTSFCNPLGATLINTIYLGAKVKGLFCIFTALCGLAFLYSICSLSPGGSNRKEQ